MAERDILAEMDRLVSDVARTSGTDPRCGGFAFVIDAGQARAFVASWLATRPSSRLATAGITALGPRHVGRLESRDTWQPPEGIQGRVLGWFEDIMLLWRPDAPPHTLHLMPLAALRQFDAQAP